MTAATMMRYRTIASIPPTSPRRRLRRAARSPPSPAGVWRVILSAHRELAGKRMPAGIASARLSEGKRLRHAVAGSKGYIHIMQTSGYNTGQTTGAVVKVLEDAGVEWVLKEGDRVSAFRPSG
ncbi:hypothetical protein C8R44DRAFT_865660 [Mycena epipterygia]|nr:hypothetical protein C8R44DRAFT_865660 [Mycena epipterygia]